MKDYHLGDILSVTTERLVSPRLMEGVYDILGFMTGEELSTHQLPRAGRECAPSLLAQHPQLADIAVPDDFGGVSGVEIWLAAQVTRFGETLPVAPLTPRAAQFDTPTVDLIEMVGDPTKVIVLDGSTDGEATR